MKDKEILKSFHIPEEAMWTWQLNVMWCPGLVPRIQRETHGKNWWNFKFYILIIVIYWDFPDGPVSG